MDAVIFHVHPIHILDAQKQDQKCIDIDTPVMHSGSHVFVVGHVLSVATLSLEADGVEDGLQVHAPHRRCLKHRSVTNNTHFTTT